MMIHMYCLAATLLGATMAWGQAVDKPQRRSEAEDGFEVLTRGPVHEAFAETVTFDPEPGLVAPKAPPAAIEEVPPEQRPEGANVAWVPGYWAWDDERTDFLWISGIWRALPPGRQWVPGYWARSGQGAQWTSGYWADATESDVEYLPEPPATIEIGPNVTAPTANHSWLPGCWLWQQNRYAWRPGYWAAGQSDWDWVPAHYVWTPRGYVFVDGYYDYSVARRGVLFAPVYFNTASYARQGFSYSPATVVSPAVFASHLFLRPGYGHYYYGDYYASNYSAAGFSPWFSFQSSRYGYDPFYAQQRWIHRQDHGWEQGIRADFQNRREHENARPPRTWTDQSARLGNTGATNRQNLVIATSLDELAKSTKYPLRLQSLNKSEQQQFAQHEKAVRQLREQRQTLEHQAEHASAAKSKSPRELQGAKVKRPPSPIMAAPADRLDRDHAPPQRHDAPRPDLKIAPTSRKAGRNPRLVPGEPSKAKSSPPLAPRTVETRKIEPSAVVPPTVAPVGKPTGKSHESPPGNSNDKPRSGPKGKSEGKPKDKPASCE